MKRDPHCNLCSLSQTCKHVCLMGVGPLSSRFMVIGEAPGAEEDEDGEPFIGRSGRLLTSIMESVGIDRDELYITNAVHCRPPENRTPTKKEIKACQKWLSLEFQTLKPKAVLILGAVALQAVLGLKGIKKLRGQPIEQNGVTYLPTWHPSYVLRDERAEPQLRADLAKFKAIMAGGGVMKISGLNYKVVRDWDDVADMIRYLKKKRRFVYDLETTGLSFLKNEIVSINIGDKHRQFCIPVSAEAWSVPFSEYEIDDIVQQIDKLNCSKANHNIKFDCLFMRQHFGVNWLGDFDTMLAHYILDENSRHGLDDVAMERYGALDWDIPLRVKQGREGTLKQHAEYACLDIMHTDALWEDLDEDLAQQPGLKRLFYELMMPVARMFVDIEEHGVTIDKVAFDKVEGILNDRITLLEYELNKMVGREINWGSTKQVGALLFNELGLQPLDRTAKGAPSTSESVLQRLAAQHPVPKKLVELRGARQQRSFFVEGWKPHLVRQGNRWVLHPSFKLHGTVTGRPSCENPNLQQVPRDPFIRQLITAKPGWVLLEADLSQIELRILAELSGDPEMLRCFQTGIDIHWLTALREIFRGMAYIDEVIETAEKLTNRKGLDYGECHDILLKAGPDAAVEYGPPPRKDWPGWKETRKRAKAINFGYAYGMWWKKFIIYARDNYGVDVTEKEAQNSRKTYFDLYRKLTDYHNKQRGFVSRHGYVKSLIGRKRRLPRAMDRNDSFEAQEAERQAINSPVQGFASDLNLMAALELTRIHSSNYLRIVGTVHDAILMECREDMIEVVVPSVLEIMSDPPLLKKFEVEMRVPIEAEVKIGPWSLGVSLEKYRKQQSKPKRVVGRLKRAVVRNELRRTIVPTKC